MAGRKFNVKLPRKVDELFKLSDDILAKHEADGAASLILNAWATELQELIDKAKLEENRQKDFQRDSKRMLEELQLLLGLAKSQNSFDTTAPLGMISAIRDFLRGRFRDSPRALGDWGFDVKSPKGGVQVNIPREPENLLKLALQIVEKHERDGATSLLLGFDMTKLKEDSLAAQPALAAMLQTRKNAEAATQNRDRALGKADGQTTKTRGTAMFLIASIRDILLGRYRGNERILGEWGFEVNEARAAPTPAGPVPPAPAPAG